MLKLKEIPNLKKVSWIYRNNVQARPPPPSSQLIYRITFRFQIYGWFIYNVRYYYSVLEPMDSSYILDKLVEFSTYYRYLFLKYSLAEDGEISPWSKFRSIKVQRLKNRRIKPLVDKLTLLPDRWRNTSLRLFLLLVDRCRTQWFGDVVQTLFTNTR